MPDEERALIERLHAALFQSGEALLRRDIERAVCSSVGAITSRLDTTAGTTNVTISLRRHSDCERTQGIA